jgi:ferritin-like protein
MKTSHDLFAEQALASLKASFSARRSRRSLLKGATVGAAGVVATSAGAGLLLPRSARAQAAEEGPEDTVSGILNIATTAEQLAVTFYAHGIDNADDLGLSGDNLAYLQAAVIEEQIHQNFLVSQGGAALTSTFSFPNGHQTFQQLDLFIATLEQLEVAFIAAYLAAIKQFALLGLPDLAQIAGEIATVEAEHRAIGRDVGGLVPANNFAYNLALVEAVADAVDVLSAEGYLSPTPGNSFKYQPVSTADGGVTNLTPFSAGEDND